MNQYAKAIFFVFIAAFVIAGKPAFAKADAEYEFLDEWSEDTIDDSEERDMDLYIDHYGVLKLVFSEPNSYGSFNVRVMGENNETILDETFEVDSEDCVYKIKVQKGSYSITVTSYEEDSYFYLTAYFKQISDVTYSKVAKKAKSFVGKNIKFDTIDKGNHGRLYGLKIVGSDESHIKTELYASILETQPYIDIQKKNGNVYTKLKLKSIETTDSVFSQGDVHYDKIIFSSKDYRLVFDISSSKSWEKYYYSDGIYTTVCKTDTTLSSNDKIDKANLNKLIKLLEDKNSRIKLYSSDGYFFVYLSDALCNNWIRMIKIYQKLLKLY